MRIRLSVPDDHASPEVIEPFLEGLTRLNQSMIESGDAPTSAELLRAGAVWKPEPYGEEHFDHSATIRQRGWGDCDDWAPTHAATLRATGEDPGARAIILPSGPSTYHALVERSDGSLDDPSVAAGMKTSRANAMRVSGEHTESIDILACDPHDGRVYQGSLLPTTSPMDMAMGPSFAVRAAGPRLFEARCDLPIAGSPLVPMRRARPSRRGRAMRGTVPYAASVTEYGAHPAEALCNAVDGAIYMADATGMGTVDDRYKLVALHGCLSGCPPRDVHGYILGELRSLGCDPYAAEQLAYRAVIGAKRMARAYVRHHHAAARRRGRHFVPHMPGQGRIAYAARVVR